jgi:hypothetical protein
MTDYGATPLQPIAQGLFDAGALIFLINGDVLDGVGIAGVTRLGMGDYLVLLDPNLIGDAGLDPLKARTMVSLRGDPVGGGASGITEIGVSYPTPFQVRIVTTVAGAPFEAFFPVEVIVYRAV